MSTILGEGVALVNGQRFDLHRLNDACHRVIAALAAYYSPKVKVIIQVPDGVGPIDRHADPRIFSMGFWNACAKKFDVNVDAAINYGVGPVTVKACLMGRTWCIYDPDDGGLYTPDGKPASTLDPTPMLCIFGPMEKGLYRLPSPAIIDEVEGALAGELPGLGLLFDKGPVLHLEEDPPVDAQLAYIDCPHGRFGAGRDWLRVHCTYPDGSPVRPVAGN